MAEYIERDAIAKLFDSECCGECVICTHDDCGDCTLINQIPTADVQPVKHGRWIERDCHFDFECKCSVCGYKDFFPTEHDRYWFNRNYCPNCGAKMDGEQ